MFLLGYSHLSCLRKVCIRLQTGKTVKMGPIDFTETSAETTILRCVRSEKTQSHTAAEARSHAHTRT